MLLNYELINVSLNSINNDWELPMKLYSILKSISNNFTIISEQSKENVRNIVRILPPKYLIYTWLEKIYDSDILLKLAITMFISAIIALFLDICYISAYFSILPIVFFIMFLILFISLKKNYESKLEIFKLDYLTKHPEDKKLLLKL
ncbi:TPA: hypothetical protein N2D99_002226 [Clostridium botulinum]|nr:hypothetical protein [Clostridium botulinum]